MGDAGTLSGVSQACPGNVRYISIYATEARRLYRSKLRLLVMLLSFRFHCGDSLSRSLRGRDVVPMRSS